MPEDTGKCVVHASSSVKLVADLGCDLGESPSWDGESNKLLSVDINRKRIYISDGTGDSDPVCIQLSEKVGAVLPSNQPNVLVAALERDIVSIDYSNFEDKTPKILASTLADHGLPHEGFRFNDAKASPGGQLIAGRMHNNWRDGNPGRVYRLRGPSGQLHQILSENVVNLPNGMAWDEGNRLMYFSDTGVNTVFKYPTDDEGIPVEGQQSVAFKLPQDDQHGPPDGITIDAEGNLWVAMAESGRVACFSPSGEELHAVELPIKRPTAVTFGGKNLKTLFITTRVESGSDPSPNAGGIFSTEIQGVKGAAAAYPFRL